MFGKEYSPISARFLRDEQSRVLRENRERREASGLTLREQRDQEYAQLQEEDRETAVEVEVEESSVVVPSSEPAPADPLGHLQVARLAFAVAVVLVLYLIWIRRKRA